MIRHLRAALLASWLIVREADTAIGCAIEVSVCLMGLALLGVAIGGGL